MSEFLKKMAQQQQVALGVREKVMRLQGHADSMLNLFGPADSLQFALCLLTTLASIQPSDPLISVLPPDMQKMADAARASAEAITETMLRQVVPVGSGGLIIPGSG